MRFKGLIGLLICWSMVASCAGGLNPPASLDRAESFPASATRRQQSVLRTARSLLGTPYLYGGSSPEGFDCSGFVDYVFRISAGVSLPRTTHDLIRVGRKVREPRPADLVYFRIEHQKPLHVGIYLGGNEFVHAPATHGKVNIQSLDLVYWKTRFIGARRIL